MKHPKPLSAELQQMLDRPRTDPVRMIEWTTPEGVVFNFTKRQNRLYLAANRMLAKSGFFAPEEQTDDVILEADMIGSNGSLRPMWHGRV